MPRFELTPEEQQQADDSPNAFRTHPPYDKFSLRQNTRWLYNVGSYNEFSDFIEHWGDAHLEALRVLPLEELPLHRVLPEQFLPSPNDAELVACFDGIESAFSADSEMKDGSPFASLVRAVEELLTMKSGVEQRRRLGSQVMLELLKSSLASAQPDSALRKDWSFTTDSDPLLMLKWKMGGCKIPFWGRVSTFLALKDEKGDDGRQPVVIATRLWESEASVLGYAFGSAAANVGKDYRDQEVFVLDFDAPATLSFVSVFFTEEYLRAVLDRHHPPSSLSTSYLRYSSRYDISTPEGLKEGMRGMLGLLRYLTSGEAEVERMRAGLEK